MYESILLLILEFEQVSGSPSMQPLWSLFYRYVAIDALVFVVSVLDSNLSGTREWIRRLLNEDELRSSLIFVVLNTFDQNPNEILPMVTAVSAGLGLGELSSIVDHPERFGLYVVNAKEGEKDHQWLQILQRFQSTVQAKYAPQTTEIQHKPQPQQQQLGEYPGEEGG